MKLLSIVVLCIIIVVTRGEKCQFPVLEGNDAAKDEAIKNLQRLDPLRGKTFTADSKEGVYRFQLCDNPSSTTCKNPDTASVTIEAGGNCTNAGSYTSVDIRGEDNLVTVTFSNGVPYNNTLCGSKTRETIITFYCDTKETSDMTLLHTNASQHCYNAFSIKSHAVCTQPKGLSGGSAFLIVFFTLAGAYLLFGFLYRRMVVHAKGVEQIPNFDWWKGLGERVADGCDFICRCGVRQEAKMYQGIGGDPLGRSESESEERDDRLLPM